MRFGLRSIRFRILAVFVLSLAAFSGALGYGLVQLRAIGEDVDAIKGYLPLVEVTNQLDTVVRQMNRQHDLIARETEEPRPLAGIRKNLESHGGSITDALDRGRVSANQARRRLGNPRERRALDDALTLMDEIAVLRDDYVAAINTWAAEVSAGEQADEEVTTRALVQLKGKRTELIIKVDALSDLVEGRIDILVAQTARAQNRALTVSGALSAVAIALFGLLVAVALFTLRPIGELTAQVQRLGAGDYAGQVDVPSGDEVGVLAREINAMAEAVAERDRRLKERAEALDRLSERLRQVLDTIRAGLVVVEGGRAGMSNPAAERLWGVHQNGDLPGSLAGLGPGRYEALPVGERLFDIEIVPFGQAGSLVVGEDVTERIQDRERLARSERLALVGQMLAQITHEVRNPLNALSLNAELLAEDLEDSDARALMETITGEIRRLERLTARYLEMSRGRRAEMTSCDPVDLVGEVVRVDGPALRQAGVIVDVTGASGSVVELDADALRRALRNVVLNAVEAGAGRVRIGVAHDAGTVLVTVSDDGPGLDEAQAARVFEPFFTTKARGTGLGLAISRQELEDVGGFIRCDGRPGQGCTFTLGLPATSS